MKIRELEELLPRLSESSKDVDLWAEEFVRLMKLANITNPISVHTWAMECVEGKLRGALQDLAPEEETDEKGYPSIERMKKTLEDVLEVTPQMKCKRLQKLKIQRGETIQNFNWRYKKLFNNLPVLYKTFITVEDYAESISSRPFARAQVITQQCVDLDDAFEEAELAEKAETFGNKNGTGVPVMATLSERIKNSNQGDLHQSHPFKQFGTHRYQSFKSNNSSERYPSNVRRDQPSLEQDNYKANQSGYTNGNSRCYKCKQFGHITRNCPYTYKELAEMEGEVNTRCYKCNQLGHIIRNCPYSYKELAKMEEEQKLQNQAPKSLN